MFRTLAGALKNKEIRRNILITLLLLLVYRLGCYLPVPGLDKSIYQGAIANESGTGILSLLNAVTGSALSNGAFFALGVTPYINASIIMQLLTVGIPALERLSKQGDDGKKKIDMITKIVALVLAIAQGVGIVLGFQDSIQPIFGENLKWLAYLFVIVTLVAGASFTMWIGDRITEQKVGNGLELQCYCQPLQELFCVFVVDCHMIIDASPGAICIGCYTDIMSSVIGYLIAGTTAA